MKFHVSEKPDRTKTDIYRPPERHGRFALAIILACIIASLIIILFSMVRLNISLGVWPLFG